MRIVETLKKPFYILRFSLFIAISMAMLSCHRSSPMSEMNAVYYWRTEWQLDSTERAFLDTYHINKVYCRYFDVVMDAAKGPMPNATIAFVQTPPADLEIVPTVFITEDCMHEHHDGLAAKLVKRILQMNDTRDIHGVREIQIDCDYTDRSRHFFYDFLEEVRRETDRHGLRLSATIRLHQLSMAPPPVDYGVLMLYNTGDPRRFQERNPVLDQRDVQPYVRRLDAYDLPLAAAYPIYLWQRRIYGVHVEHRVEADEIREVKQIVEHHRPELSRTIILYHLDSNNINRYTPSDYETFYHH